MTSRHPAAARRGAGLAAPFDTHGGRRTVSHCSPSICSPTTPTSEPFRAARRRGGPQRHDRHARDQQRTAGDQGSAALLARISTTAWFEHDGPSSANAPRPARSHGTRPQHGERRIFAPCPIQGEEPLVPVDCRPASCATNSRNQDAAGPVGASTETFPTTMSSPTASPPTAGPSRQIRSNGHRSAKAPTSGCLHLGTQM